MQWKASSFKSESGNERPRIASANPPRGQIFGLVAGIVLLFFLAWEAVERRVVPEPQSFRLHLLHLLRGIGASLAAAGLVIWLISRALPAPEASGVSVGQQWWARGQITQQQWERNYGRWFMLMRWIAVGVCLALIFFATQVAEVLQHDLWRPLTVITLILAFCNACYWFAIRRDAPWSFLLPVQICVDLLLLAALLHYSGGIENPLSLLMVFHVIIAGIVLNRRQCYLVAAVAGGLYSLLALGEWSHVLQHYTLGTFPHHHGEHGMLHAAHTAGFVLSSISVQITVLFLTAYFITTLAERVRYDERELAAMVERATAQRQLLEQAMETTGTGLRVLDRDMHCFWLNDRWSRMGLAVSKNSTQLSHKTPAQLTFDDGQVRTTESEGHDGASHRYLQITTAPLFDQAGAVQQVVELALDVTRQKEAQARLIQTSKLEAIGELAGHVAHEVNNPIGIISAKARLLLDGHRSEISDHVAGELTKIAYHADRVARVAQGLLSYCRPAVPSYGPVEISVPVRQALGLIEQKARSSEVEIVDRVDEGLPPVLASCDELEQVFCNLFINALDAMPNGGRLSIEAERAEGWLQVDVADTGCGMSAQTLQRVFEPFFSTKPAGRGTGLGLSICRELLSAVGGTIEARSEAGAGSRFVIRLPLAQVKPNG